MNMNAPIKEQISPPSPGWETWFGQASDAVQGWVKSYTTVKPLDFPAVAAGTQQVLQIPAKPLSPGAIVLLVPLVPVAGVLFTGYVTLSGTDGVLNLVASNISGVAINPAAGDFRIIVLQN